MEISKEQKCQIKKIAQKYNLELILLFGSHVSGKVHPDSDLDIAIQPKGNRDFKFDEHLSLISDLGEVFRGKEIDLTLLNRANPLLLKKISDSALLLFGKKKTFSEFKLKAFKYFQDYLPYFKLEESSIRQLIKHFSYGN